ncbi:protein SAWADEE HOMEODOMAIN HOMOLOG 2-like [Mangifera indica]|uniref:protein SAWADEE HOMEODOMAIN HOMOLOG 2-like n=1 Tax=Mangifera indica TaxID=29780 RepID=UPI001CFB3412|nr:protein SAWADEE HOMEODOMAIN HOMOLOG 2-like [Mangifera indica]
MGRPPSNGGPAFRFTQTEVMEMEGILQEHHNTMPSREILVALSEKFSESPERKGKIIVQMKQVWNWFQNRRYAVRAKTGKAPGKLNATPVPHEDPTPLRNVPQPVAAPIPALVPASMPASVPVSNAGRVASENTSMEFEAKSARDGAWYDVAAFLAHRKLESIEPEVQVRFAGFGPEEDEWVNIKKHVRQRSLPCEASECVAVLPGDLILCFQEGKDQALYFDAHVLDAQRRRHDVRGCRCRFLVRYDHDQSEEIVPLRKVCRRPETDYRLQQLHAMNDSGSADQQKSCVNLSTASAPRVVSSSAEIVQKQGEANIAPVATPVSVAIQSTTMEPKSTGGSSSINVSNPAFPSSAVSAAITTAAPGGPGGKI